MAVLKLQCPECDASIRKTIDDEADEIEVTCPRCNHEFTSPMESETAKQDSKKSMKANKRGEEKEEESPRAKSKKNRDDDEEPKAKKNKRKNDDEDDDEDEQPRKKKKKKQKEQAGSKTSLIIGGVVVLLLAIGGIVAAIALSGKPKDNGEVAKGDSSAAQKMSTVPGPGSSSKGPGGMRPTGPGPGTTTPTTGTGPGTTGSAGTNGPGMPGRPSGTPNSPIGPNAGPTTNPSTGPNPGTTPNPSTGPNTVPMPNPSTGPNEIPAPDPSTSPSSPPKKNRDSLPPGLPPIPPPPKLRLHAPESSVAGTMESSEKIRPTPPLSPDDDPFVRAKSFVSEGKEPMLPKLPPANQRPVLALDSGGHSAFIRNVFITPNNDRIITIGEDKAVRFWDIKTGTVLNTIRLPAGPGGEGALQAAALSSKGKLAVSGTPIKGAKQGTNTVPIFILNADTGAILRTIVTGNANVINLPHDAVVSLSFSNDGSRLAAGTLSGTLQVFDVNTGGHVNRHDFAGVNHSSIQEVKFSPAAASKVVAVLFANQTAVIADLGNTARIASLNVGGMGADALAWSNDARFVAVGGASGEIKVFNAPGGNLARTIPKHEHKGRTVSVSQIHFLPGDAEVIYGGMGDWTGVVSVSDGKVRTEFTSHTNTIFAVTASADGKSAVTTGGNQNETYVWDTATGKIISRLSGPGKGLWGIGWSQDGKSLAWGTKNMREDVDGNCPLEEIFRLDELGPGGPAFQGKFQQQLIHDESYLAKRGYKITQTGEKIPSVLLGVGKKDPDIYSLPNNEHIYSCCVLPGRGKVAIGGTQALYLLDPKTKELKSMIGTTGHTLSIAPSPDGKYFVSGSSDQTIRIWKPEQDEPILSIFVVGPDWIAWTPQGYYACSPNGESLLAWQVNNATSPALKAPQVYPASRYRPSLYQPAIIKYLIPAGGALPFAMAMAQKFDKALVQTTSVADILPPEVTLEGVQNDLVIDQDTFSIKATAKGSVKQPITTMRLMVDGRPFKGSIKKLDAPGETGEASWAVPLTPGPHTFAVIAETPVSKGMSQRVTITRKGDVPKPNLYILSIGIAEYAGPNKLPAYSAEDASRVAKAFQSRSKGVYANIEIRILMDKEATKKGMRAGLDWLKSKMTPSDVGIVFFSGHGTLDPEGKFHLCPVDLDDKDPFGTCFAGNELKSRLDDMPGRLVAILNSCHSGEVTEHEKPPPATDSLVQDLSSEDSGVVVMCASLGREYARTSKMTNGGFFSTAIIEGLEGHADVNEDGVITLTELDMFAYARVKQLSYGMQHSTTSVPAGIRSFPLATVPKSK